MIGNNQEVSLYNTWKLESVFVINIQFLPWSSFQNDTYIDIPYHTVQEDDYCQAIEMIANLEVQALGGIRR